MRPEWLRIAEEEARLGVREVSGLGDDPRILVYHESTTLRATEDSVPWCAAFVGWCLLRAGLVPTGSAAARSYLNWGREIKPPPLGAIVVLARGDNPAQGHAGFLVGQYTPTEVLVLAGNQEDAVNVRAFPTSRVLGMRWPG